MPLRNGQPVPSSPGQRTIDYTRADQRHFLRECYLPDVRIQEGKRSVKVSGLRMKAVLRAIDDHNWTGFGDAYPSLKTLARCSNDKGVRNINRAVAGLTKLSLISSETRSLRGTRVVVNHYRIIWNEVALLCQKRPIEVPPVALRSVENEVPPAQIKVPPAQIKVPPVAHKSYEAKRNVTSSSPPQELSTEPSPTTQLASWEEAEEVLRKLGISKRQRRAILKARRQEPLPQLAAAIDEGRRLLAVPANFQRFDSPLGAFAFFLEEKRWPISEPLLDPAKALAADAKRRARAERAQWERVANGVIRQANRDKVDRDEFRRRVFAAVPAEIAAEILS